MPHKKSKRKTLPKHKKKKLLTALGMSKIKVKKSKNPASGTSKVSLSHDNLRLVGKAKKPKIRQLPIEVMSSPTKIIPVIKHKTTHERLSKNNPASLTQAKKIREQVWVHHNGKNFETKCYVTWCTNMVNVFNFQVGHDKPKAHGGSNELLNLKPICQNCNQSMGSRYSIMDWNNIFSKEQQMHLEHSLKKIKIPISTVETETTNKIDLCSENNSVNNQKEIIPPTVNRCPFIENQTMKYGVLGGIIPYANTSIVIDVTNPGLRKNKLLHRGITVLGAVVLAGAWLFNY